MAPKLVLYNYWRSSCSWRVRSVLELKKIPYEYRAVSLYTGEQHTEEFLRINPVGQVPTLQVETPDGRTENIFESLAIIDYLEQIVPTPSVYPKDPIQRAKVVTVAETIVSGVQALQNLSVMNKVQEYTQSKEKAFEWSSYWIDLKFQHLEKIVNGTAGKYTVGDEFSLADICLVPQVYNAIRFKVDMAKYPTLKRLYDFLLSLDGPINTTKPENQPDKFSIDGH